MGGIVIKNRTEYCSKCRDALTILKKEKEYPLRNMENKVVLTNQTLQNK